jgi:hypothetical protein
MRTYLLTILVAERIGLFWEGTKAIKVYLPDSFELDKALDFLVALGGDKLLTIHRLNTMTKSDRLVKKKVMPSVWWGSIWSVGRERIYDISG